MQWKHRTMASKKTFDNSNLSPEEKGLLRLFQKRREIFDQFIKQNELELTTCPGCGFPSFTKDWFHDICQVCNWQHDGQDDPHADEIWGGPNYELSLTENRLNIGRTLNRIAKKVGGSIMENPTEVLEVFSNHQTRMNSFDDEKMMDALRDDPIWKEWKAASKEVLTNLIKKGV